LEVGAWKLGKWKLNNKTCLRKSRKNVKRKSLTVKFRVLFLTEKEVRLSQQDSNYLPSKTGKFSS
jgi:hypothetical protein